MGLAFDGSSGTGDPERDEAVIVYYGDGASSQGDVHEAMVFAASYQTPEVFFLQNNQWAISVPVATQSRAPLYQRGEGYGIPSVAGRRQRRARQLRRDRASPSTRRAPARGPRAIEAMTYRMGAHTTSDDPTKYRTSEEEESWRRRDPIDAHARRILRGRGASDGFFADVDAEAPRVADDVRVAHHGARRPRADVMFDHVYSEPHPLVDEQRAWLAGYEASFEEDAS